MKLRGKKALVTGASTGIGAGIARHFAAEGAQVAIAARNEERLNALAAELGEGTLVIPTNIRDLDSVTAMGTRLREAWGHLDIVVANAGLGRPMPFEAAVAEVYHEVVDTNFRGTLFTVSSCLPLVPAGGSILLMSSIAHSKGLPTMGLYCATKAAIRSMGRTLAAELAGRNIRVNVISPGAIDTAIYENAGFTPEQVGPIKQSFLAQTPLARLGSVEEVARCAAFLVSDEASFVTGADLMVDGGWIQV